MESFKDLGLSEDIIKAIEKKGYTTPTEIQAKAIPILLTGEKDIVGQAQTGTGKTASFALPLIEKIEGGNGIKALILTPTRELALQITKEFDSLKGKKKLKALTVYGGAPINHQINELDKGVDIVVGTPGRVIDLIKRRYLDITGIEYCVLDEADEMLNMGFIGDIEKVLKKTPKDKKMLLFCATMPSQIKKIAEKFMRDYITIKTEKHELIIDLVKQIYYDIHGKDRFEGLRRIIDITEDFHGIVFCRTRREVDDLCTKLLKANYPAGAIHGEITQGVREKILGQFKKKKLTILIATDVAARGIDVNDLTHVVNYSLPQSPEIYVHRIGRTGRAGKEGVAITFVIPSERYKLKHVEKAAKCKLIKKELPKISDVVNAKQVYLEEKIVNVVTSGNSGRFDELAAKLLDKESAVNVVSALLEDNFGKEEKKYTEVGKVAESSGRGRKKSSGRWSTGRNGPGRRGGRSSGRRSYGGKSSGRRSSSGRDRRKSSGSSDRRSSSESRGYSKRSSRSSGGRSYSKKKDGRNKSRKALRSQDIKNKLSDNKARYRRLTVKRKR